MGAAYEDREAIRDLTARYNLAADAGDVDAYADCWVAEGVFDIAGLARLQGHEALKAMIAGLSFPTLHVTTDAVIEVDGDCATQLCSFILFARKPDENDLRVLTTARYRDRLTRTEAGWRFVERIATTDNNLGAGIAEISPEFAAAMGSGG